MLSISLDSTVPLHDQLVAEFRRLIATGALARGDELPPVRQLAADLGINLNTVARAYRDLTDRGLVVAARGRGTVVISSTERPAGRTAEDLARVEHAIAAALADGKLAGITLAEMRAMVDRHAALLWAPAG
jgi:GntR family transcriptional regulator